MSSLCTYVCDVTVSWALLSLVLTSKHWTAIVFLFVPIKLYFIPRQATFVLYQLQLQD